MNARIVCDRIFRVMVHSFVLEVVPAEGGYFQVQAAGTAMNGGLDLRKKWRRRHRFLIASCIGVMEIGVGWLWRRMKTPWARALHVRCLELPHTHNDGNVP